MFKEFGCWSWLNEIEVKAKLNLCLQFAKRTACLSQKHAKQLITQSSMPFCNITGNRDSSSSHLALQTEDLALRKSSRLAIDISGQLHRPLPDNKLSKMPRSHNQSYKLTC